MSRKQTPLTNFTQNVEKIRIIPIDTHTWLLQFLKKKGNVPSLTLWTYYFHRASFHLFSLSTLFTYRSNRWWSVHHMEAVRVASILTRIERMHICLSYRGRGRFKHVTFILWTSIICALTLQERTKILKRAFVRFVASNWFHGDRPHIRSRLQPHVNSIGFRGANERKLRIQYVVPRAQKWNTFLTTRAR